MRAIPLTCSILLFWEDLVFLESALLANPETEPLAAPVTETLDGFQAISKLDLESRRAILQSQARGVVADDFLDGAIRRVFASTLFRVQQDRSNPQFKTLFATHIGDVVRHALKRQLEVARAILEKLGLSLYDDAFRDEQKATLEPHVTHGEAVVEAQRKAEIARTDARIEIRAWKEDANAVRLSVYGELVRMAGKTKRKKDWAETFFLRKRGNEDASEAPAEEPEGDEPNG